MYGERLADEALKYVGFKSVNHINQKPEHGTCLESGFDCSGFVTFLLQEIDYPLESQNYRYASKFFDSLGILVHHGLHQKGDLVFFSYKSHGLRPDHMGIVLDDTHYIHSPGRDEDTIKVSQLEEEIIQNRHSKALYNINPIGFKRLAFPNGRWQKIE